MIQDSSICRYNYSREIKNVLVDWMHFPCLILLHTFFSFSDNSHLLPCLSSLVITYFFSIFLCCFFTLHFFFFQKGVQPLPMW